MVLGYSEIRKLIKKQHLIDPFSERENKPVGCTVDLRLGGLNKLEGNGFLGISDRKTPGFSEVASYQKQKREIYTLNPGEHVITQTYEQINLPSNLAALFKPRSSLLRCGVVLRTGIADPGYHGGLFFILFNPSQCKFQIELGARFCSVYFIEINGDHKTTYDGQWQGGKSTQTTLKKQK
jgi:deoxycytidine triphosphate deaminase